MSKKRKPLKSKRRDSKGKTQTAYWPNNRHQFDGSRIRDNQQHELMSERSLARLEINAQHLSNQISTWFSNPRGVSESAISVIDVIIEDMAP